MFAYPAEIVSISSPCQVTCEPLRSATTYGIGGDVATATDNTLPTLDFCDQGFGPTTKINNCSFCYSFIPQQLFIANFLQAIHIACRQPPVQGETFYPDGRAIFNESAIPGPAPPGQGGNGPSGLRGWQLGLVIALPVVGGALLLAATCFCCFKFTKKRRARMAAAGRMSTYHNKSPALGGDGSRFGTPISTRTPPSQYQWPIGQNDPPREMERITHPHPAAGKSASPIGMPHAGWSHHGAEDEDAVPLSAGVRDGVEPGQGQSKDPFLHEQYFGIASSGLEDAPGPSNYVYPPPDSDARGYFVR